MLLNKHTDLYKLKASQKTKTEAATVDGQEHSYISKVVVEIEEKRKSLLTNYRNKRKAHDGFSKNLLRPMHQIKKCQFQIELERGKCPQAAVVNI